MTARTDVDVALAELLLDWRDDITTEPYPPKLRITALLEQLEVQAS